MASTFGVSFHSCCLLNYSMLIGGMTVAEIHSIASTLNPIDLYTPINILKGFFDNLEHNLALICQKLDILRI